MKTVFSRTSCFRLESWATSRKSVWMVVTRSASAARPHLSSLAPVELDLDNDDDAMEWLRRSPNLEKLNISDTIPNDLLVEYTQVSDYTRKVTLLKVKRSISAFQLLDCPALEDLTIDGSRYQSISHFHDFVSRCPLATHASCYKLWGGF